MNSCDFRVSENICPLSSRTPSLLHIILSLCLSRGQLSTLFSSYPFSVSFSFPGRVERRERERTSQWLRHEQCPGDQIKIEDEEHEARRKTKGGEKLARNQRKARPRRRTQFFQKFLCWVSFLLLFLLQNPIPNAQISSSYKMIIYAF